MFNKLKKFEFHQNLNFSNNIDLRKQVFLSAENTQPWWLGGRALV